MKRLCYANSHNHHLQSSTTLPLSSSPLRLRPHEALTHFSSTTKSNNNDTHIWKSKTNVIITNPSLLAMESCTTMRELKQIQAHMTRNGLIAHAFPASRVLAFSALADAGDLRHARALFARIERPNTYMWNTMIRAHWKAQSPELGFEFFVRMVREGVEVNELSFVFALKACERSRSAAAGESACCAARKMGFGADLVVRNGVVRYYSERGCLVSARKVFEESPVRDVVTWTTMIDGYAKRGFAGEAVGVFESMLASKDVEPNDVTLIAVLSVCGGRGDAWTGRRVYEDFVRTEDGSRSLNLMNAALDMFLKCGCFAEVREIFEGMETRDVFTWTSMVNGYAKFGELDSARRFFDGMPEKNAVSWNAIIACYSQNSQPKEALKLFHDMRNAGFDPTEHTLVCVLSCCGQLGCRDLGEWIHRHYVEPKRIRLSTILSNALVDMYAKCGSIDAAASLFNAMPERNLVSWNTMIAGYATHGYAKQSLTLFEQMKRVGPKPNCITFVAVLSACSHGGLVSKGREYFESMTRDFGVEPKGEHYACMIDLLGRIGLLKEAHDLIKTMPMEPSESAWGALLNACRMYGDAELAELSARELLDLDPRDSGVYVLLASALANDKRWGDVRRVRSMMRERGVKKSPGRSLIEIEGEFHEFLVGDETHPQSKEIYKVLDYVFLVSNLEDYDLNLPQTCEPDYAYGGETLCTYHQ